MVALPSDPGFEAPQCMRSYSIRTCRRTSTWEPRTGVQEHGLPAPTGTCCRAADGVDVLTLAIDPKVPRNVYASTESGVVRAEDGNHWHRLARPSVRGYDALRLTRPPGSASAH